MRDEHLRIRGSVWLVERNRLVPSHALFTATMHFLAALEPVLELAAQIDDFQRRHFRPYMIGVHLRRGDFVAVRPHVAGNTDQAMACVDQVMLQEPDAGILLCTDDGELRPDGTVTPKEGVVEKFRNRYGERVVLATAREAGNVRDSHAALFDLVLLRRTQAFVGTYSSSFSDVASVGRDIPKWFVAGGVESYRRFDALLRYSGLQALMMARDRRIHGAAREWFVVRRAFEAGLRKRVARVKRRLGRL